MPIAVNPLFALTVSESGVVVSVLLDFLGIMVLRLTNRRAGQWLLKINEILMQEKGSG